MTCSLTTTMETQTRHAKVQRGKGVLETGHLLPASQLRPTSMAGGCTPWETAVCCPLAVGYSKANRGQLTASSSTPRKKQKTQPRRWLVILGLRFRHGLPTVIRVEASAPHLNLSRKPVNSERKALLACHLIPIRIVDDEQHGAKNRETAQNNFSLYGCHRRKTNKN